MSGGVANVVLSGPLILAVPVAVAAGAVTFLSPCVLPLVPGYLSYVTGMSGTAAGQGRRGPGPQDGPGAGRRAGRRPSRGRRGEPGGPGDD